MKEHEIKLIEGMVSNGISKDIAQELWETIDGCASYLFNKCLPLTTKVLREDNALISLEEIKDQIDSGKKVILQSFDPESKEIVSDEVVEFIDTGEQEIYEIQLSDGSIVQCTMNHQFLCADMKKYPLSKIIDLDLEILKFSYFDVP